MQGLHLLNSVVATALDGPMQNVVKRIDKPNKSRLLNEQATFIWLIYSFIRD